MYSLSIPADQTFPHCQWGFIIHSLQVVGPTWLVLPLHGCSKVTHAIKSNYGTNYSILIKFWYFGLFYYYSMEKWKELVFKNLFLNIVDLSESWIIVKIVYFTYHNQRISSSDAKAPTQQGYGAISNNVDKRKIFVVTLFQKISFSIKL